MVLAIYIYMRFPGNGTLVSRFPGFTRVFSGFHRLPGLGKQVPMDEK